MEFIEKWKIFTQFTSPRVQPSSSADGFQGRVVDGSVKKKELALIRPPTVAATVPPGRLIFTRPGQSFTFSVSHLVSSSEFWIQLDQELVKKLLNIIDLDCSGNREFTSEGLLYPSTRTLESQPSCFDQHNFFFVCAGERGFSPGVGQPCLAYSAEDGRYFRAIVNAVNVESVTVFYIDYGSTSTVRISDLRAMPSHMTKLRAQAVKCALEGLDGNLDGEFVSSALHGTFEAELVKIVDDIHYIRLSDEALKNLKEKISEHPRSEHGPEALEGPSSNEEELPNWTFTFRSPQVILGFGAATLVGLFVFLKFRLP